MANDDVIDFSVGSFFLMMFITGLLTIATGGTALLLTNTGQTQYDRYQETLNLKIAGATPEDWTGSLINKTENPTAFDIVLAMFNVGALLLKITGLLIILAINYFTIGLWITTFPGAPTAIIGIIVFVWNIITFRQLIAFIFKDRVQPR